MITLTDGTIIATLPDDLLLTSEFVESEVKQVIQRTIGGRIITQRGKKHTGLRITLEGTDSSSFIKHGELLKVKSLYNLPNAEFVLNLDGETYNVIFDYRGDDSPIEADMIFPCSDPSDDMYYTFKIRLLKI